MFQSQLNTYSMIYIIAQSDLVESCQYVNSMYSIDGKGVGPTKVYVNDNEARRLRIFSMPDKNPRLNKLSLLKPNECYAILLICDDYKRYSKHLESVEGYTIITGADLKIISNIVEESPVTKKELDEWIDELLSRYSEQLRIICRSKPQKYKPIIDDSRTFTNPQNSDTNALTRRNSTAGDTNAFTSSSPIIRNNQYQRREEIADVGQVERIRVYGNLGKSYDGPNRDNARNKNKPKPSKQVKTQIVDDDVHFSVTSSRLLNPGETHIVTAWAYLYDQQLEMTNLAKYASGDDVRIQSRGPICIERGTTLNVCLKVDGLAVEPEKHAIKWVGEIGNAGFLVIVPDDARSKYLGKADFYLNEFIVATLYFELLIGKSSEKAKPSAISKKEDRYRTAFASYASKDRRRVLERIQVIEKFGIDVYTDVKCLRSGQKYEVEILNIIPKRDVFYLFWSEAARKSRWVEMEWRCALNTIGIDNIDPIPLSSPEKAPPPPELSEIMHFNDWVLPFIESSRSKRRSFFRFWR
jgi:hypothetical protein